MCRAATVQNGLFEVNELGEVYRITNGKKELASQCKTGKGGRYLVVSGDMGGKRKSFYVHRLVAEAFLPNPNNFPDVYHIDGNPKNNRVENLEWVSRGQSVTRAYHAGRIDPYRNANPCLVCGKLTRVESQICVSCKPKVSSEAKAAARTVTLQKQLEGVDRKMLTPIERKYVDLRETGLSLNRIAEICGVSKQCVDQAIKHAMVKSAFPKNGTAQFRREALRLETRAQKKRISAEKLQKEAEMLLGEAEELERAAKSILSPQSDAGHCDVRGGPEEIYDHRSDSGIQENLSVGG